MQKKISIIIPVYKVEKFLDKCVESVTNQTYKNIEIILVDDGSPDNCPKMCDLWANKDDRIRVIHKENGGLSDARNMALDIMSGDYVMFVDSDDYIHVEMCEKLVRLLEKNNCDFVMSGLNLFNEDEEPVQSDEEIIEVVLDEEQVISPLLEDNIRFFSIACAKLYKSEIFAGVRYEKGRLHEDEFAITQVILNTKKFAYTNDQLYYYLQRMGSITKSKTEKNIQDSLDAFEVRHKTFMEKFPERINDINLAFMRQLRGLYVWSTILKLKELQRTIKDKFIKTYKNSKIKSTKDKLFKKLTWFYVTYSKIKNKGNFA